MTNQTEKILANQFLNIKGVSFVYLKNYYSNTVGKKSDILINIGSNMTNLYKNAIDRLNELNVNSINWNFNEITKFDISDIENMKTELINMFSHSLDVGIGNNENNKLKDFFTNTDRFISESINFEFYLLGTKIKEYNIQVIDEKTNKRATNQNTKTYIKETLKRKAKAGIRRFKLNRMHLISMQKVKIENKYDALQITM